MAAKKSQVNQDGILLYNEVFDQGINVKTREIQLNADIDDVSAVAFRLALNYLENLSSDPITVHLNTPGGSVTSGFSIIDAIKRSPCHIKIVATGEVCSMGIPILASGDERISSPLVMFMFHEMSYNPPESRSSQQKDFGKVMERYGRLFTKFMADHTKRPQKFWSTLGVKVDYYFFAEEALDLGIIDKVE